MTIKPLVPMLSLALLCLAGQASATPGAGSKELRIGQQLQPPLTLTDGFIRLEPEKGEGTSGLGLGAGFGYFVSDPIEIGLSLSLQMLKSGQSDAQIGPGASPFVRFIFIQGRAGFYAELVAEFRKLSSDRSSTSIIGFGGDLGVEVFVTDDWAVRLAPTFRHLIVSNSTSLVTGTEVSNDTTANRFGITWGLAAYF